MQTFLCPACGHSSTYDPWVESARCDNCGYTPPQRVRFRGRRPVTQTGAHQRFLDELVAHWKGSHVPDPSFELPSFQWAQVFFHDYQQVLGEA
ncbi:MAG: hypothetical protein JW900_10535 [Anaerolineae bacterium]|nr:hypothetical protein [Anaerolineae bacterium]